MIAILIEIIFALIVFGVLWWGVTQLLPLIPLPEPIARIVHVLMTLILVLVILWVVWQLLVASGVVTGSHVLLR